MKKTFFIVLACASAFAISATLLSNAPAGQPCIMSTYYTNGTANPVVAGKLDTFVTTEADTLGVACKPTSITFSNAVLKCAGTPTVTVALYASADGGTTYGTTPLTTYTVTPTSTTVPVVNTYVVNSNGNCGNPYTHYAWVHTNSASSTCSFQGKVLTR